MNRPIEQELRKPALRGHETPFMAVFPRLSLSGNPLAGKDLDRAAGESRPGTVPPSGAGASIPAIRSCREASSCEGGGRDVPGPIRHGALRPDGWTRGEAQHLAT